MLGKDIIEKEYIKAPRASYTRLTGLTLPMVDRVLSGDTDAPIGHFIRVSNGLGIPFDILPRASKEFITTKQAALRLQAKCLQIGEDRSLPIYLSALEANQSTVTPSVPRSQKYPPVFCIKANGHAEWYEEDEFTRFIQSI